jgi:two-component system, cell cycle sensor histidine kinase and response regulator CckA
MQATQLKPNPNSYAILLVEDEGLIARDIAQRLEQLGHRVVATVSTGEEAVEAAAHAQLVLMDIRLDGRMDGIQAAEIIRRRFAIPVVFLTAHADRATLDRAKLAEPYGYIVKPVAPAALYTSIEIAVYKHTMARELAEREAWLAAVLRSVADAVVVADVHGKVRTLNPAAESLTGWTEAEAKGHPLAEVAPLAVAPEASNNVSNSVSNNASVSSTSEKTRTASSPAASTPPGPPFNAGEGPVPLAMLRDAAVSLGRHSQLTTRTGRSVAVEGSAAPVRLSDAAIGSVLSLRDVGQRRWEEQQLQQAQKVDAAARLAAGVVDEYTTLLTVIRTQAERLLQQFADYSPARSAAEEIRQAAAAAEQITRKLAGFGKRQPGNPTVLSPNGVLRRMTKLLETVAGPGIHVTVRPALHAGKVNADEGQFEQLLMNLTMHAGRMSAAGGEIRIETGAPDSKAAGNAVANQGANQGANSGATQGATHGTNPGVTPGKSMGANLAGSPIYPDSSPDGYVRLAFSYTPATESDAPFDPVPQDDESMTLSVAHNIVTEHNGFFSVRRTSGNRCLEVLLPRWVEPEAASAALTPAQTRTVLFIEPRELVRSELHKFFEANGFNLIEATNMNDAITLAEFRDEPIDLLIASSAEVASAAPVLQERHPELFTLSIVDQEERGITELRQSFTQAALLDRVRLLLKKEEPGPQTDPGDPEHTDVAESDQNHSRTHAASAATAKK